MADIADIGVAFDTSGLQAGQSALQGLVQPAKAAESSASKLSATLSKLDNASDKLLAAASGLATTTDRLSALFEKEARSANAAASGMDNAASSANAAAAGMARADTAAENLSYSLKTVATGSMSFTRAAVQATGAAAGFRQGIDDLDSHVKAYRANFAHAVTGTQDFDSHITAFRENMAKTGKQVKLTANDLLTLGRQGADVGVTAFSGMNLFMVALQQGPQIFDALQVAAIRSGTTVKAVWAEVGRVIWTALAPLLPVILGITAAAAGMAAAWGLATRSIGKEIGKNIDHLKLNEKQVERLKDKNVELGVTSGDVFRGLGKTIKEGLGAVFGDELKAIDKLWNGFLDNVTRGVVIFIKSQASMFGALFGAIKAVWTQLPAMMSDAFTRGANLVIEQAEKLGNAILKALNPAAAIAGSAPTLSLGRLTNRNEGALERGGAAIAQGAQEGSRAAAGAVDAFGERWVANTRKARDERLRKAAGKAGATPKGGKTDAEKFSDITQGAQSDIDALKAEREAIGLTAKAAAELEMRTKLLSQAREKGIKLTEDQKKQIDALSASYGVEKQALIDTQFAYEVGRSTENRVAELEAERKSIGLVGRELTYQTELTRLLTEAKGKNVTITDELTAKLQKSATEIANAQGLTNHGQFYNDVIEGSRRYSEQLSIEAATIGMTVEQARAYTEQQNMLNEAKRQGVELTSGEILLAQVWQQANSEAKKKIDEQRESMQFLKDTSRGFFDDMRSGLTQGQGFWKSFGNAVMGVLDKLASKLTDSLFDGLFGAATGGAGGLLGKIGGFFGLKFAKGSAFDGSGIAKFANGGAFTNSVVRKPTLFQFANGGALGEMGEAGPEAIMPLMRGPDGSLGVAAHGGGGNTTAQSQRVEVDVKVYPTETLYAEIETIAQDKSIEVTQQGIAQYDAAMPSRVNEIASDDRVR